MYRREDDIIILYNLITLIYLPFWFILLFVYRYEFPPRPYLYHYRRYNRETYILLVFIVVYVVEHILGFKFKLNKYIVIICNLITFYLLNRLAGYFFLERREMPITYLFVFGLVTVATFFNVLIELSTELKNYLLPLDNGNWIFPEFVGYKYEEACKKYWRGIFRLIEVGAILSLIYFTFKDIVAR